MKKISIILSILIVLGLVAYLLKGDNLPSSITSPLVEGKPAAAPTVTPTPTPRVVIDSQTNLKEAAGKIDPDPVDSSKLKEAISAW